MSPLATSLRFLQTQPDHRLVELAHDGHERAFEALVHRYRRQLLAYCRRLTGAGSSAEDLLQQALLQAWVAIGRDAEIRDVRAWLYRIAHNVCISDFRRNGVAPADLNASVGGRGADFEVERRLAAREALACLAALPDLQRQVMLSTALEGRSHEEIAALMGLSNGAVRGLIYRARATLRAAAAALIPGPVITWAVRQDVGRGPGTAGLVDAIAAGGGGAAGIGGLVIKGAAVVAAVGGLATGVGVGPVGSGTPSRHGAVARAGVPGRGDVNGVAVAAVGGRRGPAHRRFIALSPSSGRHGSQSGRGRSPGGSGGSHAGRLRSRSPSRSGEGSGSRGPSRSGGGSGSSSSGGHDGGGGSDGGSGPGSGSGSGSGSGGSGRVGGSGRDGGSSGGSGRDGGSSGGSLSSSDGHDGGTSGGGSSGGSDGGSTLTGVLATSGHDGSGSGH